MWQLVAMAKPDPLKIMLSGAPASGKGTQCELITKKVRVFLWLNSRSLLGGFVFSGIPLHSMCLVICRIRPHSSNAH